MDLRQLLVKGEAEPESVPEYLLGVPRFDTLERARLVLVRGDVLTLQVHIECELPVRYQWYFGSFNMPTEEPLTGQTKSVLSFATNYKTPTGHYRCRVFSDRCPEGSLSRWFFVLMKQRRMGPQKRFFVQVRRS